MISVVSTVPFYSDLITTINSTDINSALRYFVKFYHERDINEMIMKDQYNHYKANIKYIEKKGKKKVRVSYHPFEYNAYPKSVIPLVNNLNEPIAYFNNNNNNNYSYPFNVDNTFSSASSIILPLNPTVVTLNSSLMDVASSVKFS